MLQFVRSYMAHVAGWSVVADVRATVYEHLQRLSLRFYEDRQTGQLMSRVVNDTDLIEHLIAHAIPDVIANTLMLVGVIIILANMNWKLTLLSMIPVPMIVFAVQWFTKYVRPAFRARQAEAMLIGQSLTAQLLVRAAHAAQAEANPRSSIIRASREYRLAIIPGMVSEALSIAAERAQSITM